MVDADVLAAAVEKGILRASAKLALIGFLLGIIFGTVYGVFVSRGTP